MPNEGHSDDPIIAEARRRYRRMWWTILLAIPVSCVAGIVLGEAMNQHHLPGLLAKNPLLMAFIFGLAIVLVMLPLVRRVTPPKEAKAPHIMRRLINDYQRRAMIAALLIAVILPVQSVIAIFAKNGPHSLGTDLDGWLVPAGFIFTAMLGVFVVCFGPIRMLSDELTRTLRARAAKLGFLLAVPGMSAVYLISLYKPEWGTVAAPPIIAAAVVLPALYYVFLDWRSGCRDG